MTPTLQRVPAELPQARRAGPDVRAADPCQPLLRRGGLVSTARARAEGAAEGAA